MVTKVKIGEIASSISRTHNFAKPKLIFLNTSDILRGKILHKNYSEVSSLPGQAKKSIAIGDILFSEIRPANGRWALIDFEPDDFVVSTKLMVIRGDDTKVLPEFLYQYLTSYETTDELRRIAEARSGTFPQITFDEVANLEINLPSLEEQKRIVCLFGSLDKKRRVNSYSIGQLELIMRGIYKSWFIDFDLCGEGKVEHKGLISDLVLNKFPNSFVDSKIGPVPANWTVLSLGEICKITIGGVWGKDNETIKTPDAFYCLRGVDMDELKDSGYAKRIPVRWDKESSYKKRLLTNRNIVVGGSGAGPVGKSMLWDETIANLFDKPVAFSNFVKRFEAESDEVATFVAYLLDEMYESREIFNYINGTSVPNLQDRELLQGKLIALPPKPLLVLFNSLARNLVRLKYSGTNMNIESISEILWREFLENRLYILDKVS
jgi:restriction endonuclease S subunit